MAQAVGDDIAIIRRSPSESSNVEEVSTLDQESNDDDANEVLELDTSLETPAFLPRSFLPRSGK